jgi:23S rRNA pseudouridine1911/1915/1917 synthase
MDQLFQIIHENECLLVINKPAGLVCHPTKADVYSSLISRVRLHLSRAAGGSSEDPGVAESPVHPHLVNRLDRETSGVVMVAKSDDAARELRRLWESREVRKEYTAIVHGHLVSDHGLIDAPLGKDVQSRVAIKDCVRADGLASQTEYWVEQRFWKADKTGTTNNQQPTSNLESQEVQTWGRAVPAQITGEGGWEKDGVMAPSARPSTLDPRPVYQPFTLVRVQPLTGRKHQIRIHLAHIGHPVVGEKLYSGDEDLYLALVEDRLTVEQRQRLLLPCHALHACALRFTWRGQALEFCCDPEPDFQDFLRAADFRLPVEPGPSPALRAPSPIRWERDGVRVPESTGSG